MVRSPLSVVQVTHEWADGIAAELVRKAASDNKAGSPDSHDEPPTPARRPQK